MSPTRANRAAGPDPDALTALTAPTVGRLQKAVAHDPVLRPPTAPVGAPADVPPPDRRRGTGPGPGAAKTKVGFLQDPDDTARTRAAYEWTRLHEGHRSFSEFIAAAVIREVTRLEAEYHDGQPWPGIDVGQLPTGRPLTAGPHHQTQP